MSIFTAGDRTPFTYIIKCVPTGELYYGVRYAKGCQPSDLWKTYFTSSKKVKERIQLFGVSSFDIQIRKVFSCAVAARIWEDKVLRRMNVIQDPKWLNQNNGVTFTNRIHPLQGKRCVYIFEFQKYKWVDLSLANVLVEQGRGIIQGAKKPEDHGKKVSQRMKGRKKSESHLANIIKSFNKNPKIRGYKIFTDGKSNIRIQPGDVIPNGFVPGSCTKGKSIPNIHKGQNYEEIYGRERSDTMKMQKSKLFKDNNPGSKNKGKNYEEIYGQERADKLRAQKALIGKQNIKIYNMYKDEILVFSGTRLEASQFLHATYGGPKNMNNIYNRKWLSDLHITICIQYMNR